MKKQITVEEAVARMQKLCSMSEKCSVDVLKKLNDYGINSAEAKKIIAKLQADKFIDDARFAFAYARTQQQFAKWGKKKIEYNLLAKQISANVVADALAEINTDKYNNTIREELLKKMKTIKAKDKNDMTAKLLRFALSRGYEYDLAYNEIKKINL